MILRKQQKWLIYEASHWDPTPSCTVCRSSCGHENEGYCFRNKRVESPFSALKALRSLEVHTSPSSDMKIHLAVWPMLLGICTLLTVTKAQPLYQEGNSTSSIASISLIGGILQLFRVQDAFQYKLFEKFALHITFQKCKTASFVVLHSCHTWKKMSIENFVKLLSLFKHCVLTSFSGVSNYSYEFFQA